MKATREIEYRTLQWLEFLASGAPLDRTNVEAPGGTFATWPGPSLAAARRLAAHANAARGRDLLWLVGVKDRAAIGAEIVKLESWLSAIIPHFDGLAPRIVGYRVPVGVNTKKGPVHVVALHIETNRAPFVIRRGSSNGLTMEVPWLDADGGALRSAGRMELIKLLAPLEDLPQFEVLEAELTFYKNPHASTANKAAYRWTLDGSLYVVPRGDGRVVIPLHRCRGSLASADGSFQADGTDLNLTADQSSPGVRVTESAAMVEGLGRVFVYCCGATQHPQIPFGERMSMRVDLVPAGSDRAVTAVADLRSEPVRESNQAGRWKL